jgi:starch-binding outer membrane protein, SusD/RagB family
MKTRFFIKGAALLALFLVVGCGDEFLKRSPLTDYNPNGYFSTKEAALQGLIGVYDMLQKDGTYNRYIWSVVHGRSDDGNEAAGDSYSKLVNFEDDPTTVAHNEGWIFHYQGITRANALLDGLAASTTIAPADLSRAVGEAKFLRSLFYFNLVNIFGGVPVITTSLSPKEANLPRNTIAEVYAQIEEDCLEAIAALPLVSALTETEKGRATKGSAQALLARAYLYQGKYDLAAQMALDVINSNQYILTPGEEGFRKNFLISGENGVESIFEVQYSDANANKGWAQEEGNQASNWLRPGFIGGWSGQMFSKSFREPNVDRPLPLQGIDTNDPRRKYTLTVGGTNLPLDGDEEYRVPDGTAAQTSAKHWSDQQVYGYNDVVNWIVLRYAEVLLIRAEALIEANVNLTEATSRINEVRARVGLPDLAPGKTQAELRDLVRYERRIELAQEGTRFWDLRRWNLLEQAMEFAEKNYLPKFEYAPIPQNQIDLSQKVLKQNVGYD